jgi:tetraacyldisaccharide 4'-kinase
MREPAFWRRPEGIASLLAPLAAAYGAVAAWRMTRPGAAAGVPVVCIGNLTVGGAGKTPAAMAVAKLLQDAGRRPFVLSRGYGGRLAGPVQVDPDAHDAAEVGDEPLLLARVAPTIVARDRVAGAAAARAAGADVIVMDDGFQNPSLHKDISLVVIDGRRGIGNGKVLPAGPLRAPLDAQLARAHGLLVIGDPGGAAAALAVARALPVFRGRLEPDAAALAALRSHKVLAFAGIGDPEKFFATLHDAGIDVRAHQAFPDHHPYRRAEAAGLIARAERESLVLVTTEKDLVRLQRQDDLRALAGVARALPVELVVEEAEAFRRFVLERGGERAYLRPG